MEILRAFQSVGTAEKRTTVDWGLLLLVELLDLNLVEAGQLLIWRRHLLQRLGDLHKCTDLLLDILRRVVLMFVESHAVLFVEQLLVVN